MKGPGIKPLLIILKDQLKLKSFHFNEKTCEIFALKVPRLGLKRKFLNFMIASMPN
jgi:hypothetical protein